MTAETGRSDYGVAPKSIAFYLPQFHPIPENDRWWGQGFTEWRNVASARPAFRGHYQPHIPADLGFYDLRVPETRAAQAELAQAHGIHAFCYYHYWFLGKRLLERPFNDVLESGEPSLPFMLCWANENWTRAWDGGSSEVLLRQEYSPADDVAHLRWLARAFADDRYVRIGGRPVFLVYKASELPEPRRTTDSWRSEAQRLGIGELYLLRVESYREPIVDPRAMGFDGSVEFQPDTRLLGARIPARALRVAGRLTRLEGGRCRQVVHRYSDLVDNALGQTQPDYKRYRCITPSWDNSPRRDGGLVLTGSSPEEFRRWLVGTMGQFRPHGRDEDLLFVNAWNEWAEGNHLEPCLRFGHRYLEVHRDALVSGRQPLPVSGDPTT
jgi:lipopolysaccharide biosynthesis protein